MIIATASRGDLRLMSNHLGPDCTDPEPEGARITPTATRWTAGKPPYVVSARFALRELDEKARP